MSPLNIAACVAVGLFVVFLVYRFFFAKRPDPSGAAFWPCDLSASGIHYNSKGMLTRNVKHIAAELAKVRDHCWSEYQRIYGEKIQYHLEHLVLDDEMEKPAQGKAASKVIYLNPTMNYRRAFGAELHNMFRASLHNPNHVYCHEAIDQTDLNFCLKAQAVWQEY